MESLDLPSITDSWRGRRGERAGGDVGTAMKIQRLIDEGESDGEKQEAAEAKTTSGRKREK